MTDLPDITLPPSDTVEFFRAKGSYPVSRRWWEVWQEEHTRAFTVAGITDRLVLQQVRASLDEVLANGGTFAMWKEQVLPGLIDARDRGVAPPNIISDARLRIIYGTNLRMARAAGQWKRIQQLKGVAPYLMYSAVMDERTRPLHRQWHKTVLPVDHPWWNTHFPPCGWNCRCKAVQLTEDEVKRRGLKVSDKAPDDGPNRDWVRGDGVIESVPPGIDPGFAYNVGQAHMRGLVPAPLDGPILEPKIVSGDLPEMPTPTSVSASALLPKDTPYDDVINTFLDTFGTRNSAGAVVLNDALGEPLVVDESFFFRGGVRGGPDTEKLVDSDRRIHIRLLAEALKNPDEIWYVWEEVKDRNQGQRSRLSRRYVARYEIEGKTKPMVIVVEIGPDGWRGITAVASSRKNYANSERVRGGVLAYRRK